MRLLLSQNCPKYCMQHTYFEMKSHGSLKFERTMSTEGNVCNSSRPDPQSPYREPDIRSGHSGWAAQPRDSFIDEAGWFYSVANDGFETEVKLPLREKATLIRYGDGTLLPACHRSNSHVVKRTISKCQFKRPTHSG